MAIQGLRTAGVDRGDGTYNGFIADQRPLDWRTGLLMLHPNGMAPLTALTSQMKKRTATDPEFNWWDKALRSQRYQLGVDLPTGATVTLTTPDALEFRPGHMVLVENTGEIFRVTTVDSATQLTVLREATEDNPGAGTAVDISVAGTNPYLQIIGSAFEEGSQKPVSLAFDPVKHNNFTQIFRSNLGLTRTAMKTRLRTGDQVREAKRECLEYHGIEMERAFWLGAKQETSLGGSPIRYTGGFQHFIDPLRDWSGVGGAGASRVTDYTSVSGVVDMLMLETLLKDAFEFGSSEKVGFCGNTALMCINQIVRKNSVYNIYVNEKEYGMKVARLVCPFGEVVLKTHPLWNQSPGGTVAGTKFFGMDSWLAIMDMANMTYRPLEDSDTKYLPDQQTNGQDGMESGYLTEAGLEFAHPQTMALARGLAVGETDGA